MTEKVHDDEELGRQKIAIEDEKQAIDREMRESQDYFAYDDIVLEKMVSRFSSYDELLRYIKSYGLHRHFE